MHHSDASWTRVHYITLWRYVTSKERGFDYTVPNPGRDMIAFNNEALDAWERYKANRYLNY